VIRRSAQELEEAILALRETIIRIGHDTARAIGQVP